MDIRTSVLLCLLVACCCCVVAASRFDPSTVEPLGDPPAKSMNETELLEFYGHQHSLCEVETEDGYILPVLRMGNNTGPPVLMLNGVGTPPEIWLVYGSHHGLAYVLHDMGYDIWFPGKRGVSRKHKTLKWRDPKFWDFSHDEHGQYDLPPQIDLVMKVTGHKKLLYVGASNGGSIFMSMCSLRPEYCDKFMGSAQIVPTMLMPKLTDLNAEARTSWEINKLIVKVNRLFGMSFMIVDPKWAHKARLCGPVSEAACLAGLYIHAAVVPKHVYKGWIGHIIPLAFYGLSVKQLEHYIQMMRKGGTAMYDYGTKKNMEKYGRPTPPEHDLSKIKSPTLIVYSMNDYFVPTSTTLRLAKQIGNNSILYPVKDPSYGHTATVIGKNIYKHYFPKVVDFFDDVTGYPWK